MLLFKIIRNRMSLLIICLTGVQLILLVAINFLARENSQLKRIIQNISSQKKDNDDTAESATSRMVITNKNPRQFLPSEVTILLLKRSDETSGEELRKKLKKIKRLLPTSPIKWSSNSDQGLGKSLNRMISEVLTEYFFVLEAGVSLSEKSSEGIATLWHSMERYPEIDFLGGSYLSGDKLHVSCQRFRLCKWTFSESYEYKRSLDNLMICEGTSTSFMGRTESVKKVKGGFDEKISDVLVMKDFFVRARDFNVVVASRPSYIMLVDEFKSLYDRWQSGDITKDLVAFAVKYKVFLFKDEDENTIDLCSSTSLLSGKDLCIETNAHRLMLNNGHWGRDGLYTYPFLMSYLKVSLREVTNFFEQHNVNYILIGGVSLGAVKMHSILPWDAGDLDIYVYGMSLPQLLDLLKPWGTKMGYVVREHEESGAVHVFCTPKEIGDVSGGLATIFPQETEPPPKYMRIKTNGMWIRYSRDLFKMITDRYGGRYLEHKLYRSPKTIECTMKGHNACLYFKSLFNGKGGTYREYFCEI